MARAKVKKIKMVVTSPADRHQTVWLPQSVAWAAARGIARDTHHVVTLFGDLGRAFFNREGGGIVEWDNRDGTTEFTSGTIVRISD